MCQGDCVPDDARLARPACGRPSEPSVIPLSGTLSHRAVFTQIFSQNRSPLRFNCIGDRLLLFSFGEHFRVFSPMNLFASELDALALSALEGGTISPRRLPESGDARRHGENLSRILPEPFDLLPRDGTRADYGHPFGQDENSN